MSLDIMTLALAKSYTDQHSGGGGAVGDITAVNVKYTNPNESWANAKQALDGLTDYAIDHDRAIDDLAQTAHTHDNKAVLDLISAADGKLKYNSSDVGLKGDRGDPGVVISTTQPTSNSHPVWINPQGSTDQYLKLNGIFTPVVKTTMDDVAQAGVIYCLGEQTAVTIPLPNNADVGQMISVVWYNGVTAATLSISGTMLPCDYAPIANSRSEVNALWDGRYWSIVCNEAEVPS